MRISVLPQKKQNYNCQAFILASLFYIPLVMSSVYVTDYLNSKVVLKSRDNEVRILMRSLEKPPEPEPVKQVTVPAPPPQTEPLAPPEPPAKQEPPKVQPPVKKEPPVKPVSKPKQEKKPPVKPRKEKKTPAVRPASPSVRPTAVVSDPAADFAAADPSARRAFNRNKSAATIAAEKAELELNQAKARESKAIQEASDAQAKAEEAYEFAMKSDDPTVLQTYLDTNPDAPEAHRDSVEAKLQSLKQTDIDWTNAVVSGSRTALEDYLTKHPNSEHKADALHKIDSLDWIDATNGNSEQSYTTYLNEHANGEHVDQANNALKLIKAKTVQPEEKTMVSAVIY